MPTDLVNEDSAKAVPAWFNRTVAGAGITSALGDFCYENITVILPGFLAVLGIPAAALGLIEGAADAVARFTKMLSAYIADKLGHRKLLVTIGYGLTPFGQALIARAGLRFSPHGRYRRRSARPLVGSGVAGVGAELALE